MSTITIHVDDTNVLDIIATLLQWPDIHIHIDQGSYEPSDGPTVDPNQASWDFIAARDVATRAAEAAARAATTDAHPLVVTIGEQERAQIIACHTVHCSKCKAVPGQSCLSPKGDSYFNTFVHTARRIAYGQSRRAVTA